MKKLITILVAVVTVTMLSFTSFAQTNVSGGIYVNTTWTLANSPYIVTDTVVVFPGVTLTIQPGVVVKFDNHVQLEIRQSTLIANGTSANPITFTSNSSITPGFWESVYLNQSVNASFNYCNFLYANHGIWDGASSLLVKNSNFYHNIDGISPGILSVDSCIFRNNTNGIAGGDFVISNSIISNNTTGLSSSFYSKIVNCTVNSNQTGIGGEVLVLINSIVDSNSIVGVVLQSGGPDTLINNQIKYNGIGFNSDGFGPCYVTKNIFEYNTIGIRENSYTDTIFCNKICNSTTYDFYYIGTSNNNISIGSNYFCTPDSTTTAAVVYDGYDNINYGLVRFMPLDTSGCYNVTASINEIEKSTFSIYPNPATSSFIISSTTKIQSIKVFNVIGEVIQQLTTNASAGSATGNQQLTINSSQFANGIYFVQITLYGSTGSPANVVNRKVVVQ